MEINQFVVALLEKLNRKPLNRYQLHRSMWDYCPEKTAEEYSPYLKQVIDDLKRQGFVEESGSAELTNPLELTEKGHSWLNAGSG